VVIGDLLTDELRVAVLPPCDPLHGGRHLARSRLP
jgi:hypothetical protein